MMRNLQITRIQINVPAEQNIKEHERHRKFLPKILQNETQIIMQEMHCSQRGYRYP